MDPVLRVANSLHGALKVAAQLFTQLEASPGNVFVGTNFARDIAAKLADAAADAAALHESSREIQSVATFVEDFREKADGHVIAVQADSEALLALAHGPGVAKDKRTQPEFVSTTEQFALGLARSLSQIVDHVVSEFQHHAHHPSLKISEPQFAQGLAACLRQTLEAHVTQSTMYKDARAQAEDMATQYTELKQAFSTQIEDIRKELAQLQEEKTKLVGENDQLQGANVHLRVQNGQLHSQKEQLRCSRDLLESENARMKAEHEKDMGAARIAIDRLTTELLAQRSAQGTLSFQFTQTQGTLMQTREEANWNRMRADSEEKERKRLAAENEDLKQQIEKLASKVQDGQTSKERKDAEVQTPLTIRVPVRQTPARNSSAPTSVSKRTRTEEGDGRATKQVSILNAFGAGAAPPEDRAAELSALPVITIDLSASSGVPAAFTRPSLKEILGGNVLRALAVRVAKPTLLASQHKIETYLCATWSRYTWLPQEPGEHGYLPYDLDIRADAGGHRLGEVDTPCHLFVGSGTGLNEVFHYYGRYRLSKVAPLTKEEWSMLPENAKLPYIDKKSRQLAKELPKGHAPGRDDVRTRYDDGTFEAPCVRLECLEFDAEFYGQLVEKAIEFLQNSEATSTEQQETSTSSSPSKRRRLSGRQEDPTIPEPGPEVISPHNIDDMYA